MEKSPDAFRTIGEVARLVGVAPHVLRYWEGQFAQLSPVKRADGRRYYRPEDVQLAAGLCEVMREEGLTIRGAKRLIAADRGADLRARGARRLAGTLGARAGGEADGGADVAPAIAQPEAPTPAPASTPAPAQSLTPEPAPSRPAQPPAPRKKMFFPEPEPGQDGGALLRRMDVTGATLRAHARPLPPSAHDVAASIRAVLARQ